jgi:hypothetical protein
MKTQLYFDKSTGRFRELEIGDLVKWTVSGLTRKGIFKQFQNDNAEVNTLSVGDQLIRMKCFVPSQLLEIDN